MHCDGNRPVILTEIYKVSLNSLILNSHETFRRIESVRDMAGSFTGLRPYNIDTPRN